MENCGLCTMLEREVERVRRHTLGCLALREYASERDPEKLEAMEGIMSLLVSSGQVESPEAARLLFRHPGIARA